MSVDHSALFKGQQTASGNGGISGSATASSQGGGGAGSMFALAAIIGGGALYSYNGQKNEQTNRR